MANEFKVKNGVIAPTVFNVANSDLAISTSGTGKLKLNGLNWPASDGTTDYVLKTDGSGNLSWAAQTGGGGGGVGGAAMASQDFTGTGSQTAFTLSSAPVNINYTLVQIDGVVQNRGLAYTVSGTTLTFTEAPALNATIEVTTLISGVLTGVAAGGTTGQVLTKNSATDYDTAWTTISTGSGTVTSVSGTGTVSGLTLTGTVTASGSLTLGGTLDLSSPPAIGGTAAAAASFTTLSANSTVSGNGFSNYLASPPAIGGTTAAAGTFTTLTANGSTSNPSLTLSSTALQSTAWTTTGIGVRIPARTYTDTGSAAGTVAASYIHSIGTQTFASSNAIIITEAASLYVAAPAPGTNSTLTGNGFSIVAGGRVKASDFTGTVGATTAAAGSFTTLSASSTVSGTGFSTYLASPPAIGGTTAAAGSFTTLSASNTVTFNPANASVSLAPTGTGSVTINPATAGAINNMSIGGTTAAAGSFTTLVTSSRTFIGGSTSATSLLHLAAGTATASTAPLKFTSGTSLSVVEAGAVEYDGTKFFATTGETGSSRSVIDNAYYFYLTANGTAITTSSITDLFVSAAFTMQAGGAYIIEWHPYLTRTSNSSPYTFTVTTSQNFQAASAGFINAQSALTASNAASSGTAATTLALPATSSMGSTAVSYIPIRAYILANATTGGTVKLQVTQTATQVTLQRGSHIIVRRLPTANTGAFA